MHNTLRLLQPTALLQPMLRLHAIPDMAGPAMATAQDPTPCASVWERARWPPAALTLSPMPNGKPLSSASGTAESASSAIAFRRPDYWLKPRRKSLRTPRTTREVRHEGIHKSGKAWIAYAPQPPGARTGGQGLAVTHGVRARHDQDNPSKKLHGLPAWFRAPPSH